MRREPVLRRLSSRTGFVLGVNARRRDIKELNTHFREGCASSTGVRMFGTPSLARVSKGAQSDSVIHLDGPRPDLDLLGLATMQNLARATSSRGAQ